MNPFYRVSKHYILPLLVFLLTSITITAQSFWTEIEAGGEFSVAIKDDGTMWAWGANLNGNLGTGDTLSQNFPVQVGTEDDWAQVSAGGFHVLAIKEDGTLWAWGADQVGATGTNSQSNKVLTPTQVGTDNDWSAISAGYGHSLAIKNDGSLWGWGYNNAGQVNDKSSQAITSPFMIDNSNEWIQVSAGGLHSTAIQSDGSLWTWGFNTDGELGNGTTIPRSTPGLIDTMNTYLKVAAGTQFTIALRSDSTLWSWGFNGNEELGIDTSLTQSNLPLQIGNGNEWIDIEAGSTFSMAINHNKDLYAWGFNGLGQLGISNTQTQTTPVKVGDEKWNQVALAEGIVTQQGIYGLHSLGLKDDQSKICATGANYIGQLGDSTVNNRNQFICDIGEIKVSNTFVRVDNKINVFPNPTSNILYLESELQSFKEMNYTIYSSDGRELQNGKLTSNTFPINTTSFSAGIYFITFKGNGNIATKRFSVIR